MEILKFLIFPGFLWFLRYLNNEAQLDYFRLICILHVVLKGLYKTAFRGIESRPFYLWKLCQLLVRCAMYVSSVALAALCHSEMRIYTEYNNSPAAQPCWRYLWLGTLCRLFFAQHVVYLPSDLCGICNSIRKTASFVPPPKNWWTTGLIELVISQRNRPPCVLQQLGFQTKKRKRERKYKKMELYSSTFI